MQHFKEASIHKMVDGWGKNPSPFALFSSVTQPCLTFWDPMNRSMPGLPVHRQLPELAQTHVHWVGDAIQPSRLCHPLLLLTSVFPSIRISSNELDLRISWPYYWASASVLPVNIQDWFPLGWTGLISFLSKGLSRVFSNTTVQKHQFSGAQLSLWYNSHIHTWLLLKS